MELEVGIVKTVHDDGSMVVAFSPGCLSLAFQKDGKHLALSKAGKLHFTAEALEGEVAVGERLACWRSHSVVDAWALAEEYERLREAQAQSKQRKF